MKQQNVAGYFFCWNMINVKKTVIDMPYKGIWKFYSLNWYE